MYKLIDAASSVAYSVLAFLTGVLEAMVYCRIVSMLGGFVRRRMRSKMITSKVKYSPEMIRYLKWRYGIEERRKVSIHTGSAAGLSKNLQKDSREANQKRAAAV